MLSLSLCPHSAGVYADYTTLYSTGTIFIPEFYLHICAIAKHDPRLYFFLLYSSLLLKKQDFLISTETCIFVFFKYLYTCGTRIFDDIKNVNNVCSFFFSMFLYVYMRRCDMIRKWKRNSNKHHICETCVRTWRTHFTQ